MEPVFYSAARNALGSLLDRVSDDKAPVKIVRRDSIRSWSWIKKNMKACRKPFTC